MRKTASRRSTPARRLSKSTTLMDPTCSCFQKKIYVLIAIDMVFGSHHISYISKHAKVIEIRNPRGKHLAANTTQKEITSQTDQNLVIRSSKRMFLRTNRPSICQFDQSRLSVFGRTYIQVYRARLIQSHVSRMVNRLKNLRKLHVTIFAFFFFNYTYGKPSSGQMIKV